MRRALRMLRFRPKASGGKAHHKAGEAARNALRSDDADAFLVCTHHGPMFMPAFRLEEIAGAVANIAVEEFSLQHLRQLDAAVAMMG